jgi:exo-1,4-beta-D-glucosaminidase
MKITTSFPFLLLLIAGAPASMATAAPESTPASRLLLRQRWAIQSSAFVRETGDTVSRPEFKPKEWYPTSVPSTVLNTLVQNKVYPDPYFGMNLRSISGTSYPIGAVFSQIHMPPDSPFRPSWWYRTEFQAPADYAGKTIWLHFEGINYRANVWLNGRRIASADQMAGAWRLFEFDVTRAVEPGRTNSLAVEIFPPQPDDLAINFVDWNPMPPDKNMGIWRGVYLCATGPVAVRFPQVITRLAAAGTAKLTVLAELRNATKRPVKGVLKGKIEDIEFSQPVRLDAGETRVAEFSPDAFPQLTISSPRLWWPAQVGKPDLYPLTLEFEADGTASDRAAVQFGIREVTSVIDEQGHRVFRINGKSILIRGAGYSFDMLLRSSPERQEAELKYVLDMNLNTVRFEGKLENDHFLELCDRYGILVLAGWCCCDHWERWADWKEEDHTIAGESLKDQIRRLRSHPSVFDWMNGSDNPPSAGVEQMYIKILKDYNWPNPVQSSATQKPSQVTGPTGVKMTGPYEYVPPSYWLLDKTRGGAHGFNTETGPGPAVPPLESLRRMLPKDHLWPIDSYWDYHAGGGVFSNINVFTTALEARYGKAKSLEDYAQKAQVIAYEGHRAMFEAFGGNKYTATGVIQWMLNNAWPSMIWHLYDYYLRPGGSYFGAKKACEPLHVQYAYDDGSIVVVNSYYQAFPRMKVRAKVYNLDMTEKFSREAALDVGPDSSSKVFAIPNISGLTPAYFVRLVLEDSSGKVVSSNFYWLSTKPDVLDWDSSLWYYTPTKSFGDLTALQSLPMVDLKLTAASDTRSADAVTRVTIENPSSSLAFFVHLKVKKGGKDEEILPVLWQDNYFSLLPGEKRETTATYRASDLQKNKPVVEVDGWNVKPKTQP